MKKRTKYVREGSFVAEVDVQLIESEDEWSPYLSVEDACMLDDIRELLRTGQIRAASEKARVYELTPVTNEQ
jgi:hypothetical protein